MKLTKQILNKLILEAITVATTPLPTAHEAALQLTTILTDDYGATHAFGVPTPGFRRMQMDIGKKRLSFMIGRSVDKIFWRNNRVPGNSGVIDLKPRKDMDGNHIHTSDGNIAMDFQPIIDIIKE